jgi:hypothetical protein
VSKSRHKLRRENINIAKCGFRRKQFKNGARAECDFRWIPFLLATMAFSKLLSILLLATAAAGRMVVHESRLAAPAAFVKKGAVPADQEITLRFALTSNDLAGLQNKLKSVSTPGSPEFRRWLTKDQVESCVLSNRDGPCS